MVGILLRHSLSRSSNFRAQGATQEIWWSLKGRRQHTECVFLQDTGPIVRISPYELHIDDPDYYEVLYSKEPKNKYAFYADQFGLPDSGFGTVDYNLHRIRRTPLNPFFSTQRVRALEPVIRALTEKLCRRLEEWKKSGRPLVIKHAFSCLTTDIITEYCLTKDYGYLDDPEFLPSWSDTIRSGAELGALTKFFPFVLTMMLTLPESWVMALSRGMGLMLKFKNNNMKQIKAIIENQANEEIFRQKMSSLPTMFHELLNSDLPESEKTAERLVQEVQAIIGAGTETTAMTLSIITYYLLEKPEMLEKMKEELFEFQPNINADLHFQQLEQLPYLSSIVLEGLRLSYGLSTRLQRIDPHHELQYGNWTIPRGVSITSSPLFPFI